MFTELGSAPPRMVINQLNNAAQRADGELAHLLGLPGSAPAVAATPAVRTPSGSVNPFEHLLHAGAPRTAPLADAASGRTMSLADAPDLKYQKPSLMRFLDGSQIR